MFRAERNDPSPETMTPCIHNESTDSPYEQKLVTTRPVTPELIKSETFASTTAIVPSTGTHESLQPVGQIPTMKLTNPSQPRIAALVVRKIMTPPVRPPSPPTPPPGPLPRIPLNPNLIGWDEEPLQGKEPPTFDRN